jgi:cyclohexanecarboxylate-CoA ligase
MTEPLADAVPADHARYYDLGCWRGETFVDDLRRHARENPDRLALVSHFWETSDEPDVLLTYAELAGRVDRVAAALVELGVERGDRVAMQLVNQWQASVLALACARIGAVVIPMFIATGPADIEYILAESEATVAVTLDEVRGVEVAKPIAAIRNRLPALRYHIVVGDPAPYGALGFADHLMGRAWEERHPDLDARAPAPGDLFEIMYTSGTTGRPKGVMHSYNTLHAMALSCTQPLGFGPDDVLTTPCIVGGQGGFLYGLLCPLITGATALWADAFSAPDFLDLAERYGITGAYFTPLILDQLITEQRERPRALKLRHMTAGSSPIPPTMPIDFHEVFGLGLHSLWGMTENGGVTISRPDDPWDWAASSDGRPTEWMSFRLTGDDGREVASGGSGRLEIKGANQCLGYYRGEDMYAESLHEGWFCTGDIAAPDGRGGIKILGRVKDLINKGGLHVPSLKLENLLRGHPQVKDAAVVGEPAPPLGERIVAFVIAEGAPPSLADLQAHVRAAGMTPGYEPDRLEIVTEFPRTPTGKVLKRELERAAAESGAAPAGPAPVGNVPAAGGVAGTPPGGTTPGGAA